MCNKKISIFLLCSIASISKERRSDTSACKEFLGHSETKLQRIEELIIREINVLAVTDANCKNIYHTQFHRSIFFFLNCSLVSFQYLIDFNAETASKR